MIAVYSLTCETDCAHADAYSFDVLYLFRQGAYRGTRGHHVVDDEHVPASELIAFGKTERMLHVLGPADAVFSCLTAMERRSPDSIVYDGQAGSVADAQGYHLALVEAALTFPLPGKRHGQQRVDVVEEVFAFHGSTHKRADVYPRVGLVEIFNLVDDMRRVGMRLMVHQRIGFLEMPDLSPERLCHRVVVGMAEEVGERQLQLAGGAEHLFIDGQTPSARATGAGRKEVEKGPEQF